MQRKGKVIEKEEKNISVTVIIPTFNSQKTIERAINSVVNQTFKSFEIIIVDDCSTDIKCNEVLRVLANKYNYINVMFLEKNSGPATARNTAWNMAKGKYIAFLDSDDVWHPQKLEIQYKFLEKNKEVYFLWHHKKIIKHQKLNGFYNTIVDDSINTIIVNPIRLLFKHYTNGSTSSVMLRNNVKYRFLDGKKYSEDYLLWLEILFNYKGVLLDTNLAASFKADYGESGLSLNLWKHEKGELETFRVLYKRCFISYLFYICASFFSLLKFVRRILISKYNCIKNNFLGE